MAKRTICARGSCTNMKYNNLLGYWNKLKTGLMWSAWCWQFVYYSWKGSRQAA